MESNNLQPKIITPGSNMPVAPESLTVVEPPKVVATKQQTPIYTASHNNLEIYSHSSISKKYSNTKKILLTSIAALTLLAFGLLVIFFGSSTYSNLTNKPNKAFEGMLYELMSVKTEFQSAQYNTSTGIFSAKQDRDSTNFFTPKTRTKLRVDIVTGDTSTAASITSIGVDLSRTFQNLELLSIKKSGIQLGGAKLNLVTDKWVNVPSTLDYKAEGLVVGFFEASANFGSPYRFLPTGYLDEPAREAAYDYLISNNPYSYDCSAVNKTTLIECNVRLNKDQLKNFYVNLAKQNNLNYDQDADWPEQFKIFIDAKTNLPSETIVVVKDGTELKTVNAYNIEISDITAPAGALGIDEYRAFAEDFENTLK